MPYSAWGSTSLPRPKTQWPTVTKMREVFLDKRLAEMDFHTFVKTLAKEFCPPHRPNAFNADEILAKRFNVAIKSLLLVRFFPWSWFDRPMVAPDSPLSNFQVYHPDRNVALGTEYWVSRCNIITAKLNRCCQTGGHWLVVAGMLSSAPWCIQKPTS